MVDGSCPESCHEVVPLGPGAKLEVRRVTDESDFADYADNEYIQKEQGWREQEAQARGAAG